MGRKKEFSGKPRFAVLGAGHGGLAMAAHLAVMGFEVNIFNRSKERIDHILDRGGIDLEGVVEGFGVVNRATTDMKEAIEDVDVIMVVVPASGHRFMAEKCAPYLRGGQIVLLNPGRTCGALEFFNVIYKEQKIKSKVLIAEANTFIYVSRHVEFARAKIFDIKNSVPVAALPAYRTPAVLKVVRQAFPQFVPGTNVLVTSLDNIGAVFHPTISLLNAGRIEDEHADFEFYLEGVMPSVGKVLEAVDRERVNVGAALGVHLHTAREWLYLAYDSKGKTLYDAIHATPGYRGVKAPTTLNHRYILEDVPFSLVPIASLGDLLKIPTPAIKSLVQLASLIHETDFWEEGRTVEKLGLVGKNVKYIRLLVVKGK
ncbi:MAG: NAD/NADP octopine/nopaline dehydrogenase family protein [Candidatus Thermoplasmatota archaeon]